MSVNLELHYLLSGLHLDNEGIQQATKRAELSAAVNIVLQSYAEQHLSFSTEEPKHCFCNEPTYQLHTTASICPWRECFTEHQLKDIEEFCTQYRLEFSP